MADRPPLVEVLDADYLASAPRQLDLPAPVYAEVAFAGRSNVGKSSLMNRLLGRRRLVRTSGKPGCTRGLSLFRARLRIRGESEAFLDLVDLPGYGYAKRSKVERKSWGPMIEGFLEGRAGLRAVVVLVDVRRGPEEDDEGLFEYLEHLGIHAIPVVTKLDQLPKSRRQTTLAKLATELPSKPIGFSALEGIGVEALWRRIVAAAALGPEPQLP